MTVWKWWRNNNMKKTVFLTLALLACASLAAEPKQKAEAAPQTIKTLIIAGQDGSHWSEGAALCCEAILDNSGLFDADVLITPDRPEDMDRFQPDFDAYQLIVLDYGGVEWAEPIKKAFEDFVREGGAVTIIHSSVVPLQDWVEYNKIIGMGAWYGRNEKWGPYVYVKDGKVIYDYTPGYAGYHGLQHNVVIEHYATEHPILKGLPTRWKHVKDEIYTKLRGPAQNMEVLATAYENGRNEPMMWTIRYGAGRVFVDLLGHCGSDPNMTYSRTCAGYQITFIRGCEWAAKGKVTYDKIADFPTEDLCTYRMDFKAPFFAE